MCKPNRYTEHYQKLFVTYENFSFYLAKAKCEIKSAEKMLYCNAVSLRNLEGREEFAMAEINNIQEKP